jgi:hypothetical protein
VSFIISPDCKCGHFQCNFCRATLASDSEDPGWFINEDPDKDTTDICPTCLRGLAKALANVSEPKPPVRRGLLDLVAAAKEVVRARYHEHGDNGWDVLKNAIAEMGYVLDKLEKEE